MRPLFSIDGAMRYTRPPVGVVMVPSLRIAPARPFAASKTLRPAVKLSLPMSSVEATSPFTSTFAPAPKTMPFGFTRNTRPLDCSAPRICEGSWPVMRFNTALEESCCTKRATSPAPMLKPGQLMIVPGVLVMVRTLPRGSKIALPRTARPPSGMAHALPCAMHVARTRAMRLRIFMVFPSPST